MSCSLAVHVLMKHALVMLVAKCQFSDHALVHSSRLEDHENKRNIAEISKLASDQALVLPTMTRPPHRTHCQVVGMLGSW